MAGYPALVTEIDDASAGYRDREVNFNSLWSRQDTLDYFVEPLLLAERVHIIGATAASGKSLLLQDIAFALATGKPILDQPERAPMPVCYVDLEMGELDLEDRLTAFGYRSTDDLSQLHYLAVEADVAPLDTPLGGRQLIEWVSRYSPCFVVIDSYNASTAGEENSNDTGRLVDLNTLRRLRALRCTVAIADHLGKDAKKGLRGQSARRDKVDIVWIASATDKGLCLTTDRKMGGKARQAGVDRQVLLEIETEPVLAHRVVAESWPEGTIATAEYLDQLDVPNDIGRRQLRSFVHDQRVADPKLPDWPAGARNELLGKVQVYRRNAKAAHKLGDQVRDH